MINRRPRSIEEREKAVDLGCLCSYFVLIGPTTCVHETCMVQCWISGPVAHLGCRTRLILCKVALIVVPAVLPNLRGTLFHGSAMLHLCYSWNQRLRSNYFCSLVQSVIVL